MVEPTRKKAAPRKRKASPRKRKAAARKAPARKATAAAKKASATSNGRQVSDAQKVAMAEGRQQSATVRKYLDALEALNGPKRRGRRRTPEALIQQLDALQVRIAKADPVTRVKLTQQRIELNEELASLTSVETVDITDVEAQFKKVAKAFSERQGISYQAWRENGVPTAVLREAGVSR